MWSTCCLQTCCAEKDLSIDFKTITKMDQNQTVCQIYATVKNGKGCSLCFWHHTIKTHLSRCQGPAKRTANIIEHYFNEHTINDVIKINVNNHQSIKHAFQCVFVLLHLCVAWQPFCWTTLCSFYAAVNHGLLLYFPAFRGQWSCNAQVFSSSGVLRHSAWCCSHNPAPLCRWVDCHSQTKPIVKYSHWNMDSTDNPFEFASYKMKWGVRKCNTILIFSTGAFTAVVMWKSHKPKKVD